MRTPDQFNPYLLFNGPPFPVSEVCPQCRGKPDRTMRAHPWIWAGLWKDRACTCCMLGFRPPRPAWAKAFYLGSLFSSLGLIAIAVCMTILPDWHPPWMKSAWLPLAFLASTILLLMVQMRD